MGYPVVDVENFAVEPDAVRKLPHAVAKRLEVLPLVLRDGRLVVRDGGPDASRCAGRGRVHHPAQGRATLTKLGTLQFAIPSTFDRFGGEALPRRQRRHTLPDFQPDFTLESSNKLIESWSATAASAPPRKKSRPSSRATTRWCA